MERSFTYTSQAGDRSVAGFSVTPAVWDGFEVEQLIFKAATDV